MKRKWIPICLAALLLTFTGCAAQEEPTPSESPSASPTVSVSPEVSPEAATQEPEMSAEPMGTDSMLTDTEAQGVSNVADAHKAIGDIELELERLSEVEEAQVAIAGSSAAVALKFDSQYQGGIDDRMREMVEERIKGVVSGVTDISITDDPDLMEELKALGDRMDGAADMAEIQNELDAIIKKIAPTKA